MRIFLIPVPLGFKVKEAPTKIAKNVSKYHIEKFSVPQKRAMQIHPKYQQSFDSFVGYLYY